MLNRSKLTSINKTSINTVTEVNKFNALAKEWRDPNGKFKHVLTFNQARLVAIKTMLAQHFNRDINRKLCLEGLALLDIGCGAGLLCEPLAECGADVTAIDPSEHNILIAKQSAKNNELSINYIHCLASDLTDKNEHTLYDIVLNTEVIEHVADQQGLLNICCEKLKPGGLLIMATLNRTIKSYIIAILGAEYVMKYLPIGTHEWRYFIKPEELSAMIAKQGLQTIGSQGIQFNLLKTMENSQ